MIHFPAEPTATPARDRLMLLKSSAAQSKTRSSSLEKPQTFRETMAPSTEPSPARAAQSPTSRARLSVTSLVTHESRAIRKLSRSHFADVSLRALADAIERCLQLTLTAINIFLARVARHFDHVAKAHQYPRKRLRNNQPVPRIQNPGLIHRHVKHGQRHARRSP